ncbi:MAG: hypothetical protein M3023_02520 [Pseudomonadota bacterium]|nr:hypothetical protein [Pseudomonadota bacterium]
MPLRVRQEIQALPRPTRLNSRQPVVHATTGSRTIRAVARATLSIHLRVVARLEMITLR